MTAASVISQMMILRGVHVSLAFLMSDLGHKRKWCHARGCCHIKSDWGEFANNRQC